MEEEKDVTAETPASEKKRPIISLPFLVVALVLGVAAYLSGPWVMTQFMLFDMESSKAKDFVKQSDNIQARIEDENASSGGASSSNSDSAATEGEDSEEQASKEEAPEAAAAEDQEAAP